MTPGTARRRLLQLVDDESFTELDQHVRAAVVDFPIPRPYAATLERARQASGELESVVTGLATLGGHRVGVATFEFGFLGGTLGMATGAKLVHLFETAIAERLPVLMLVASGGVRVQEGIPALLQMAAVGNAARRHRDARLLQISILTDPSFGGVPAGFAMAADVLLLDPGARFGFTGARVAADSPDAVSAQGSDVIVDRIVAESHQRSALIELLTAVHGGRIPPEQTLMLHGDSTPRTVLREAADLTVSFEAHRRGLVDPGPAIGFGRADNHSFAWVVLGEHDEVVGPDGYARIRRHLRLARRLALPIVTLIDSRGGDGSPHSQARNVAGEIAETLAEFVTHPLPTMCLVVGTGSSGGAMALAAADRVVMDHAATFHVLTAEMVSQLLSRGEVPPTQIESVLRTRADHLLHDGFADQLDTLTDPARVRHHLERFLGTPPSTADRCRRWTARAYTTDIWKTA